MSDHPPKEVIAGRYRLIDQIGKGGMGSVWRAEHVALRTFVAIKLLNGKLASDPMLRARFSREAQAAAALNSAHIVRILDHGVDEGVPYIAMEFLPGESLRARLRREGTLGPTATAKVFAGVSRGIARAHRAGIVHRDLKPDNIFLASDEELGEVVKVVDFGIAKLLDNSLPESEGSDGIATATGAMLGTPYYMSPEQLRGKKQIDARSDLWALGVIAFECLTGKRPFVADAIGQLVLTICSDPAPVPSHIAKVPDGFDAWFARAVTVDVDMRFQTIHELARTLAEVLTPGESWLPTEPEANSSSPRLSRPSAVPTPMSEPTPVRVSGTGTPTATTALALDEDRKLASATGAAHSISSAPGQKSGPPTALYAGGAAAFAAVGVAVYFLAFADRAPPAAASSVPIPASGAPLAPATATPQPDSTIAVGAAQGSAAKASASVAPSVEVTFESVPPGVEVVRAGKSLGRAPGPIAFEPSEQEVTLTFRKPGYVARELKLVPSKTQTFKVELTRAPRPSDVLD